jgi:hypothetical protein
VPKNATIKTGSETNSPAAQTGFTSLSVLTASLLASLKGVNDHPHPHLGPPLEGEGFTLFFTLQTHEETVNCANGLSKIKDILVPSPSRGGLGWGWVAQFSPAGDAKSRRVETDKEAKSV